MARQGIPPRRYIGNDPSRALMRPSRSPPGREAARVARRFNQRRAAFFYWLFGAPNWETEMLRRLRVKLDLRLVTRPAKKHSKTSQTKKSLLAEAFQVVDVGVDPDQLVGPWPRQPRAEAKSRRRG